MLNGSITQNLIRAMLGDNGPMYSVVYQSLAEIPRLEFTSPYLNLAEVIGFAGMARAQRRSDVRRYDLNRCETPMDLFENVYNGRDPQEYCEVMHEGARARLEKTDWDALNAYDPTTLTDRLGRMSTRTFRDIKSEILLPTTVLRSEGQQYHGFSVPYTLAPRSFPAAIAKTLSGWQATGVKLQRAYEHRMMHGHETNFDMQQLQGDVPYEPFDGGSHD